MKRIRETMDEVTMETNTCDQMQKQDLSPYALPFARSYQLEALEKAIKENTIVFLETGSGKTLIAIMLLRSYAYLLRKPSPYIAVFLVPKVVLVSQQAESVKSLTDLKVGMYWGEMGVDYWDAGTWKKETEKYEVLVMTPAILLRSLRHSFIKLNMIKVLIMDECHHARGRDPYACIMREFYHDQLQSGSFDLPRIFGMTASPIKSKVTLILISFFPLFYPVGNSEWSLAENIRKLMTLMHSKVYTCASDAIAEFIPISSPKFKFYKEDAIPYLSYEELSVKLKMLKEQSIISFRLLTMDILLFRQHDDALIKSDFTQSAIDSAQKRIEKILYALLFCLDELGIWLALKAAESLSSNESESFSRGNSGDKLVNSFSLATVHHLTSYLPSGPEWSFGDNIKSDMEIGLLTSKVYCLVESLLEYRDLSNIRCIVFVERVISAVVLEILLNALLPKYNSWKTKFIAGHNSGLKSQTRKKQNQIVEEFRDGLVNIIVATSILEEGLDVQSCNLVIRFDPCPTVCSFIQSRGRARMQNSDYLLMIKSGDSVTHTRLEKYVASGDIMRKESLRQSAIPCDSFEQLPEEVYRVESTGAIVNLSSSITLIYLYCSWLPSDGYFKPSPRWDKENGTLYLPKSCPLQSIQVEGEKKLLKNIACLEACKQLHKIGALTDNLVPDIVVEEAEVDEFENEPYNEQQPRYVPHQLVNRISKNDKTMYYCYLIELKQNFSYDISVCDIVLATRNELDPEIGSTQFQMCFDRGNLSVNMRYIGTFHLSSNEVLLCKTFQVTILKILVDRSMDKLAASLESSDKVSLDDDLEIDYLLLPATAIQNRPAVIDWLSITSVNPSKITCEKHSPEVWTKNGLVCPCILRESLVYTPHNGHLYITTAVMELDGNSPLELRDGGVTTYKKYYEEKHDTRLHFEHQQLLNARRIFVVKNYSHGRRQEKDIEAGNKFVELPPELCCIIMSPISISMIYSFSFVPSIMHHFESLLGAYNLKKTYLKRCIHDEIQVVKLLEAITTKRCKDPFNYESLETLGDSFLKYAASKELFNSYQNLHEGLLSVKRTKIISNAALCKFGCNSGLPGFIRNAPFDPHTWLIPGYKSESFKLKEESDSKGTKIYVSGKHKLKRKIIADVVEALIGAFLTSGGEKAALLFMDWVGIKVNFDIMPYERHLSIQPEKLLNVTFLESLLKYKFRDRSLLVEALTHGSYMLPEIPSCYQRLEFLGDSILDYLITMHLYEKYPGLSPGQLTDMRSASVNNDCYAWSAIKAGLHKHILHASQELHKHIFNTLHTIQKLASFSTFGWESETSFPKVLGDIIESLAGAILVDSGYNKDVVWQSIRPLLEPLITPETLKLHPVRELTELCQREGYTPNITISSKDGVSCARVEVDANGVIHQYEYNGCVDKNTAKKLACKEILKSMQNTEGK
ncbi:putative ribonuclease III post-transcriptional gene silencing PAZ-Argonaute family [Lupinus albus]|uniref:Putative ribonuclease III post-transcriptional gene silencing PAZ-Argonaute family n=1 Tax=Lupinus albus TaxID=3870 RepID=A0A6A4NZR2_LUPAL|nr:putative ribonuclease III post-transcriptional gene silencing PAZ-Argonaute family [Lupinus albus]